MFIIVAQLSTEILSSNQWKHRIPENKNFKEKETESMLIHGFIKYQTLFKDLKPLL
jgi:hypothetical protein